MWTKVASMNRFSLYSETVRGCRRNLRYSSKSLVSPLPASTGRDLSNTSKPRGTSLSVGTRLVT